MALREFTDSEGTAWRAWDVPPWRAHSPARSYSDRRVSDTPGYAPERRVAPDRRKPAIHGLERGWLCFECDSQKRRLAPPPNDWAAAPDAELEALLRRASAARIMR